MTLSYNGLRFIIEPDMVMGLADWKRAAFPALMTPLLEREWLPNKACPPDGVFNVAERRGIAVCNERTFDALKRELDRRNVPARDDRWSGR